MHKNPLNQVSIPESFPVPVTRQMLRERAVKLAAGHGGSIHDVSKSDWDRAKQELNVRPAADAKEAVLEAAPESERWDPLPGSAGHQTPEPLGEEEDAEGRSQVEQLFDYGVEAAERDQVIQAARAAKKATAVTGLPDHRP